MNSIRSNIQLLRKQILEKAIRGELVPQDPQDEPASVLIQKIQKEKDENLHQKQFKNGKPLNLIREDEIPFFIPSNWMWSRLCEVIQLNDNLNIHEKLAANQIVNYVDIDCIDNKLHKVKGTKPSAVSTLSSRARRKLSFGTFVYSLVRPYLQNIAIIDFKDKEMIGSTGFVAFKPKLINESYLFHFLLSPYILSTHDTYLKGFNSPSITLKQFLSTLIPLPPLQEQKRIVTKIDELMKFCDELEEKATRVERNIKILQEKVLQLAIEGKLVEQDPEDEPASVLIKNIQQETEKLIKQGLINKVKLPKPIHAAVVPFSIPNTWSFTRLGQVVTVNPRNIFDDELEVSFIPMKNISSRYNGLAISETSKWNNVKNGFTHFKDRDVAVAKITPCFENSKAAIMNNLTNGIGAGTTEIHILRPITININSEYIYIIIKSPYFLTNGKAHMTGSAGQKRVPTEFIKNLPVPIPPTKEQRRIVSKVNALMDRSNYLLDILDMKNHEEY